MATELMTCCGGTTSMRGTFHTPDCGREFSVRYVNEKGETKHVSGMPNRVQRDEVFTSMLMAADYYRNPVRVSRPKPVLPPWEVES